MDSHRAKCTALRKYSNELRRAISADYKNLSFMLCAKGLISLEVRDSKAADEIVSSVEYRLSFDESAWDKLIEVLYGREGSAVLVDQLKKQLAAEMSGHHAPERAPERQQQNGSGLCIAYCVMTIAYIELYTLTRAETRLMKRGPKKKNLAHP